MLPYKWYTHLSTRLVSPVPWDWLSNLFSAASALYRTSNHLYIHNLWQLYQWNLSDLDWAGCRIPYWNLVICDMITLTQTQFRVEHSIYMYETEWDKKKSKLFCPHIGYRYMDCDMNEHVYQRVVKLPESILCLMYKYMYVYLFSITKVKESSLFLILSSLYCQFCPLCL